MAWHGWGVWSLVTQTLVSSTVSSIALWVLHPWRPVFRLWSNSLRSLFGFGSRMLGSGLLNTFFDRIQLTVIGKAFSAADLGQYSRAYNTQQLPVGLLTAVVSRVTLPVFSQISGDAPALRNGVRKALVGLMIPTLPMMFGLAVVARPLVLVLLGAKWLPCVPYLRVLSIAGAFYPVHVVNLIATQAVGRSDLFLRLEIAKKVLIGLALLATFRISVMAMVWAVLVVSIACVYINSHYSRMLIGYGTARQFFDLTPYVIIATLTSVLSWTAGAPLSHTPLLSLLVIVLTGLVTYPATCHLLRLELFRATVSQAVSVFPRRKRIALRSSYSELQPRLPV